MSSPPQTSAPPSNPPTKPPTPDPKPPTTSKPCPMCGTAGNNGSCDGCGWGDLFPKDP
ncbi:hypothetical protein N431DRAFT_436235 [Stipitochalara longipes BDJ]|nr:hypothetical protein N431DRAFT_436235 [Stipitochalara longipes BDJ]